jgi:hypothetical protein
MEFIGSLAGQELAKDAGAALDEQAHHGPFGQIFENEIKGQRVTGVDDYGGVPQARPGQRDRRGRAVHQAEGAGGEEAGAGIQVAGGGQGDPGGVLGQPAGHAAGAPAGVADEQPGVVLADGPGADEDRVAARPDLVHAVQVGRAGQDQAPRAGVIQVAVRRDGAGQDHVRAWQAGPLSCPA